ncbi:MAG: hypothetical protein A2428_13020 [Bdellovibrionales bacterium RIFOXYC1_FULL_54_43]|nr:MAG: hypothetical protein A2428_13020 [Bdellovibrionales bacterium RIFOXYC1_FULL_54_43]OFZ79624.1 MAG: hypothetical protein A2603_03935 [Bdellovibrionales bacterium RIFOXYD1_FULL_55_31]
MAGYYLVTVSAKSRKHKRIWEGEESLPLNHPATLFLEKTEEGAVQISGRDGNRLPLSISEDLIETGSPIDILGLQIRIKRARRARPAFIAGTNLDPERKHADYFFSSGRADVFLNFEPFRNSGQARVGSNRVARFMRTGNAVQIHALAAGLTVSIEGDPHGTPPESLKPGLVRTFNLDEGLSIVVRSGNDWWRIGKTPLPAEAPEVAETTFFDRDRESLLFQRTAKSLVTSFAIFVFLTWINVIPKPVPPEPPVEETPLAVVQLRKLPPPPKPKKEEPKPELAKAKPPEPKKPTPKKKTPEKKVAKAGPKKPPVAQKAAPAPKAPALAKAPPKAATPVAPARPPAPSQAHVQAVQNQARLSKSLGFLSLGPKTIASRSSAVATIKNPYTKYQTTSAATTTFAKAGAGSVLSKIANQTGKGFAAINTKSARLITSKAGVEGGYGAGGKGKALNDVQGKVSLAALYDPNAGDGMGSALGGAGGGLSMSGEGSIPESLLLKVLEKHMQKFQYCYEKALLTNAGIAGNLVLQWTIEPGGKATRAKVVRSELNHPSLHNCVLGELGRILFPSPKGGAVTVKFPFAFSSSVL